MIQFAHEGSSGRPQGSPLPYKTEKNLSVEGRGDPCGRPDDLPQADAKPYILVVDDEPSITSVVLLMLEMEGYDALAISDSPQVLPFLQRLQAEGPQPLPALILLDLMMPELSGYELAAQLRQHPTYAQIPIIIMTADWRVQSARDVPGAVDLLSKPFQISTLLNKVERYVSQVSCA
jgi:CheY-like chemotaxis protein